MVVGGTGYTGAEALRLLAHHPHVTVVGATSERQAGRPVRESCPWLATDLVLQAFDPETIDADVVLLCQENGFAMRHVDALAARARVIDFAADFRLRDPAVYARTYGREHTAPHWLDRAVYSLVELTPAEDLRQAQVVANPGCYPTATLLALLPLVRAGLVQGLPIIDAKSGYSGAGRSRTETDYLFTEATAGFRAYGVEGHRHTPEIAQAVGGPVRFVPHLIPASRGIHATIHVPVAHGVTAADLHAEWDRVYAGRSFVQRVEFWPSTKHVQGGNSALLNASVDAETGLATLVSVIDNLVKGAAGQAIQAMNVMFDLPEVTGLPQGGLWP